MKLLSSKALKWLFTGALALSSVYALITRYSNFFMADRSDKMIILLIAVFLALVSTFLIIQAPFIQLSNAIPRLHLRTIVPASILIAVITLLLLPPINFPEQHTLAVIPLAITDQPTLTILKIERIELPSGNILPVPFDLLDYDGNWKVDSDLDQLNWLGGQDSRFTYSRFMQAGIRVHFKTASDSASVRILWDDIEQFVDLQGAEGAVRVIELQPGLIWRQADLIRKIGVAAAYAAQAVSAAGLSFFILAALFSVPNHLRKLLITASLCLLVMYPLVSLADPIITFADPALESAIRGVISVPDGHLRQHRMLTIAVLDLEDAGIQDLGGIQHLVNLEQLNLRGNNIEDITPLRELSSLTDLNLRGNQVADIAPLAALTSMEELNLRDNTIMEIEPIAGLSGLRDLNLHGIPLGNDLEFLKGFPHLLKLNVRDCGISDVQVIAELMAAGLLQDDAARSIHAELDIRDNPIPYGQTDGYASLRLFWSNIYDRVPFTLPVHSELTPPTFSHTGGFYSETFSVEISTSEPNAEIHYTLDGSPPTVKSPLYEKPLHITTPATSPDDLSFVSDISTVWVMPEGEIYKSMIVRAAAFNNNGEESMPVTETYFITPEGASRFSLPVMSLVIDPMHLVDKDQGIYVVGRMMDAYDGQVDHEDANYYQRGGQWERPVHFDFFDAAGNLKWSSEAGIRIQGSSTRSYRQKSLRIIADDWYGDLDHFDNVFFTGITDAVNGEPITRLNSFILRNSGNNIDFPFFRSTVLHEVFSGTRLDVFGFQPVLVFINGEYWGIYNLRETMNEDYLSVHYQRSPDDFTILERDAQLNIGSTDDQAAYQSMLDYIEKNDISQAIHYEHIKAQMDVDNYMDYQIAEIYSANRNWPYDNIKYWRYSGTEADAELQGGLDGRWRWLLFDLDTGFGYGESTGVDDNTLERAAGDFLFRSLLENSEFRTAFIRRFTDHLNTILSAENMVRVVDRSESLLLPELDEHIARWQIADNSVSVWRDHVDIMRQFARQRPDYIYRYLQAYFELSSISTLQLEYDPQQGTIIIDNVDLSANLSGAEGAHIWTGLFFYDIPIHIAAIPAPGYKFSHWIGTSHTAPEFDLTLSNDAAFKAVFVPAR